jgi:endonuclease YncB( thermonuclease family)
MRDHGASWLGYIVRALQLSCAFLLVTGNIASAQQQKIIRVVDGDTVRVEQTIRLVGRNAPETSRARCDRERELGEEAKARLTALLKGSKVEIVPVGCSCRPGTEGTARCNRGRSCAILRVEEGLAVPFKCGETSCPPTPSPWRNDRN